MGTKCQGHSAPCASDVVNVYPPVLHLCHQGYISTYRLSVIVLFLFCPVSLPICAMRVHTSLPSRSTFLIFPIHANTKSRKGSIGTHVYTRWRLHAKYRFLRRSWNSKLSILDEVVAVFRLTTPQFLTLHPPLVNSRSLMAQFAATKTIQCLLELLKWNAKANGKRTSRISALDRNQDLDGR